MAAKSSASGAGGIQLSLLMQDIIVGLIAFACVIYLVVAVLHPEKF
jgi:K+-transporting ATPase KdpF subunit